MKFRPNSTVLVSTRIWNQDAHSVKPGNRAPRAGSGLSALLSPLSYGRARGSRQGLAVVSGRPGNTCRATLSTRFWKGVISSTTLKL